MTHLVNISSGEVVQIPEGDNLIGRGPLLKVKDNRVSRKHAILKCSADGKLSICPTHVNPCFHKPTGKTVFSVLSKDKWKDLEYGDCISLLPNGEIAFRIAARRHLEQDLSTAQLVRPSLESVSSRSQTPPPRAESSTNKTDMMTTKRPEVASQKPSKVASQKPSSDDVDDLLFGDVESAKVQSDLPTSAGEQPKVLDAREDRPTINSKESPKKDSKGPGNGGHGQATAASCHSDVSTGEPEEEAVASSLKQSPPVVSPAKSSEQSVVRSINRIRVLPSWMTASTTTAMPPATSKKGGGSASKAKKPSGAATTAAATAASKRATAATKRKAGERSESPGDVVAPAAKRPAAQKQDTPPTSTPPAPPPQDEKGAGQDQGDAVEVKAKKLPLCPYGARCYRKNPAHFREYSHDFAAADSEDGEGSANEGTGRPECPYGASCYRKNPAHLKEYSHPAKGTRQSTRTTRGRKAKQSVLTGDSDDDGGANTYDYTDSFIDDEGEGGSSSAYSEPDSDWMPEASGGGAGPGGEEEEEEDVAGLVADAEQFIRNKKMRR